MLILNKPAGMLTQQARTGDLSLNEWMVGYLLHSEALAPSELRLFRPSVCNRLDRNTSGLVLCGKSLPGSQALSELIRSRALRKFYRTLCVGRLGADVPGTATEIRGYLQKDSRTNRVTIGSQPPGEYIRTAYRPLRHFYIPADSRSLCFTEVEVELITGKTHQIRSHLASLGHPILGDRKYGDGIEDSQIKRQLLHAYELKFPELEGDFSDLSEKVFRAELPKDFYQENRVKQLIKRARKDERL